MTSAIVHAVASTRELNKRKVRLFILAVWNEERSELIDELVGHDYVGRIPRAEDAHVTGATTSPAGCTVSCAGISIIRLLGGKQVDSHNEYTDLTR